MDPSFSDSLFHLAAVRLAGKRVMPTNLPASHGAAGGCLISASLIVSDFFLADNYKGICTLFFFFFFAVSSIMESVEKDGKTISGITVNVP